MRKHAFKRTLGVLLALVMVIGLLPASALAGNVTPVRADPGASRLSAAALEGKKLDGTYFSADDVVRAIVVFDGASTVPGRNQTTSAARSEAQVLSQQRQVIASARRSLKLDVKYQYTALLNGAGVDVRYGDLDKLAKTPGVKKVYLANYYDLPDDTIQTAYANEMVGVAQMHSAYTGKGTVIAVLDTGITPDHEAFQVYDDMMDQARLSKDFMAGFLAGAAHGQYLSAKIPYAYDYYDKDDDATDDISGHGTHVCGIAAGYARTEEGAVTFSGSAPGAQILAMKVFSSDPQNRGTDSSVYFAALDEAYRLGADVVNMSLGSPGGFIYDKYLEDEVFGDIFDKLNSHGVVCCIAAGNEYSMAYNAANWAGDGVVLADYFDYGVVGSPSTYGDNLSVAAVENSNYPSAVFQVNDEIFEYHETATPTIADYTAEHGDTFEYVMIPNYGEPADYEGLDVAGRVAVISRGGTTFTEKVNAATEAGAVIAVVYNNQAGIINMSLSGTTIPAVSSAKESGTALAAAAEAAGEGAYPTITFPAEKKVVENPNGWLMCDFSSWGCTPSLTLKPQLAGIGGNVNSAQNLTTDGYQVMSGTSMATPNIAGVVAASLEYLKANYPALSKTELAKTVQAMLESTAIILDEAEGYPYSPRKQGAGLANVQNFGDIYLTDPICNLGDSTEGTFTFTVELKNLGDGDRELSVNPLLLCDYAVAADLNKDGENEIYNTLSSDRLTEGTDYTLTCSAGEAVTVPAGGSASVEFTLTLSDDAKQTFAETFANGNFVEGYIVFADEEAQAEICHASLLGFFGDWAASAMMEAHDFRDVADADTFVRAYGYSEAGYTFLDKVDFQANVGVNEAHLAYFARDEEGNIDGANSNYFLRFSGQNPFGFVLDEEGGLAPYDESRIAVPSPESQASFANTLYALPMLLRSARHLIMVVTDHETGEVYCVDDTEYLPKAYYDTDHAEWSASGGFLYNGTDLDGNPVPDGTVVDIDFYANAPYGDDALGAIEYADLKTQGERFHTWGFPCTVDSVAPEVLDAEYDAVAGTLTLWISENRDLALVEVDNPYETDEDGYPVVVAAETCAIRSEEPIAVTLDIGSDLEYVMITVADYATNYSVYSIPLAPFCDYYYEDISEYRGEPYTAPVREGKVFAGWYEDVNFKTPLEQTVTEGPAYAKFVDENVLSVKWQVTAGTTAASESTKLRLLTSTDTLNFLKVGFNVLFGADRKLDITTKEVYREVTGFVNGENESYAPAVFSPESNYFMTAVISGVKAAHFDTEFTVTPKWTTMDGTVVEGIPLTFKVSDDPGFTAEQPQ